jgi:hypothetical protein
LMVPERGLIAIGQNQNQTVIAQSMVSIFVAVILRKQESSGFWIPGRASLARNDDPTPEAVTIMCFEGINKRLRGVLLSLLGGNAQALRAPGGAKAGREVKRDLCYFSTLFFRFALSKNNFRPPSPNHILYGESADSKMSVSSLIVFTSYIWPVNLCLNLSPCPIFIEDYTPFTFSKKNSRCSLGSHIRINPFSCSNITTFSFSTFFILKRS